jgi:hypothetical protein
MVVLQVFSELFTGVQGFSLHHNIVRQLILRDEYVPVEGLH